MLVASGLQIPGWVPDYIASKARELYAKQAGAPIALAVIERLARHPDMEAVWRELSKQRRERHRRTGEPLHKVTDEFFSTDHNEMLAGFFEFAFKIGWMTLTLPSVRPYAPLAQRLRREAERLANDPFAREINQGLLSLAQHCEGITAAAHNPTEAIAVEIAGYLKAAFGTPMRGMAAIITSVITEQEINERRVRTLLRDPYR